MRTLNKLASGALAILATVAVAMIGLFDAVREFARGVRTKVREVAGPMDYAAVGRVTFALAVVLATTLVVDHLFASSATGVLMAVVAPSTIILKGTPLYKEGLGSESITPGHLVEYGGVNDLRKHATAAGNARKAFAKEYDPEKGIDDAYAVGEQVMYAVCPAGTEVYALVAAGAAAIAKGDALESAGNGTLRKVAVSASTAQSSRDSVVAYALEALDNSGGATAARLKVEVA